MPEPDLAECYALLGVQPGCTVEDLERAFLKRNFALIRGNTDEPRPEVEAERERLRAARDRVAAHVKAELEQARAAAPRVPGSLPPPTRPEGLLPRPVVPTRPPDTGLALTAFDNWKVNVLVPPLLLGLVALVNASPFGFVLHGFQVWMHEFGHATAAWLTGRRATPLPFGWTPIEPDFSWFVYVGLLFLFGVLAVAGWRERKAWPVVLAVALAGLQAWCTWRMPPPRQEFWWTFGGVGGEFYLSALFLAAFFVELPEKFRWGACRYVFFLIGATSLLHITFFWDKVYHGLEEIPFGSLINGEDDAGGDMNKLMDQFGWTKGQIRHHYQMLGRGCWIGLAVVYGAFALRLNRVADWLVARREG